MFLVTNVEQVLLCDILVICSMTHIDTPRPSATPLQEGTGVRQPLSTTSVHQTYLRCIRASHPLSERGTPIGRGDRKTIPLKHPQHTPRLRRTPLQEGTGVRQP